MTVTAVETSVTIADFIPAVQQVAGAQARFVTASGSDLDSEFEIIYHFELTDRSIKNIRLRFPKGANPPSISGIFPPAFLIENELQDAFGLEFTGISINAGHHLLLEQHAMKDPMIKPDEFDPTYTRKVPPCKDACPAGINIPKYVHLIAEGKEKEALETVLEQNPLPAICGRVCFAPCETACRQNLDSTPVAIRFLKRYISDTVGVENYPTPKPLNNTGK
ncbi:MAG: NADH-quinone oxidoreductase subunit C, partial [bacterium]